MKSVFNFTLLLSSHILLSTTDFFASLHLINTAKKGLMHLKIINNFDNFSSKN